MRRQQFQLDGEQTDDGKHDQNGNLDCHDNHLNPGRTSRTVEVDEHEGQNHCRGKGIEKQWAGSRGNKRSGASTPNVLAIREKETVANRCIMMLMTPEKIPAPSP